MAQEQQSNQASLADPAASRPSEAVQQVLDALRGLRFGQVSIIVQDGVVIQIERTERIRLRKGGK